MSVIFQKRSQQSSTGCGFDMENTLVNFRGKYIYQYKKTGQLFITRARMSKGKKITAGT